MYRFLEIMDISQLQKLDKWHYDNLDSDPIQIRQRFFAFTDNSKFDDTIIKFDGVTDKVSYHNYSTIDVAGHVTL